MKIKDFRQLPPKTTGIYKLTNVVTGKEYIGQAVNIKIRIGRYSRGDLLGQTKLLEAYKAYGPDSFDVEILTTCNKEELDDYETNAILCFDTIENGYNCEFRHSYIPKEELDKHLHLSITEACNHFDVCRTTLNGWSIAYYEKYYKEISTHRFYKERTPSKEQIALYQNSKLKTSIIAKQLSTSTTTLSILCKRYYGIPIHIFTGYKYTIYPQISKEVLDNLIKQGKSRTVAAYELNVGDKLIDKYSMMHYGCTYAKLCSRYSFVDITDDMLRDIHRNRIQLKDYAARIGTTRARISEAIKKKYNCTYYTFIQLEHI